MWIGYDRRGVNTSRDKDVVSRGEGKAFLVGPGVDTVVTVAHCGHGGCLLWIEFKVTIRLSERTAGQRRTIIS